MTDHSAREIELDATAEELWQIITSDGWLADEVELELRPGGEARFRSGSDVRSGWVEEIRVPERLTFWWSRDEEPASRVELTLTPAATGTIVRVREARPLEILDLVGLPISGPEGRRYGPALIAA